MDIQRTAPYWKDRLQLQSHIEGGAFREIYRSELLLPKELLKAGHKGDRAASTSIYFLLEHGQFSALHRIASDELWHHYDGACLYIYEIKQDGQLVKHLLGKDFDKGERPQVIIPAGSWFGSRVEQENSYTLCGCTVAPGFDFEDFDLANRENLLAAFPAHAEIITGLT